LNQKIAELLNFNRKKEMEISTKISQPKIQLFIAAAIGLFVFRMIFSAQSLFLSLINDILVLLIFYFSILNLNRLLSQKHFSAITLVKSLLFLTLVSILLYKFLDGFQSLLGIDQIEFLTTNAVFVSLVTYSFDLLIIIILSYLFLVFRLLFFLKQRKNVKTYFVALLVFLALASFATLLDKFNGWEFVKMAFTANAVILMAINSLKISWIAFLTKKEKKQLLLFSFGLIILFGISISLINSENGISKVLNNFSPSLNYFNLLLNIYGVIYFSFLFVITLFHLPTAEAFDRKATEVTSLQILSRLINQVLDFKELGDTITDLAIKVCNADAAWIILTDDETKTPVAPKNIGFITADKIQSVMFSHKNKLALSEISFANVAVCNENETKNEHFCYAASAPLKSHQKINGYLFVAKKAEVPFDDEDKNAMETFSDYASIAIENAKLLKASIEKERLERELDVAREMQGKILPQSIPKVKHLEISSVFVPAFEVGGDYYDFFELPNNKFGFIIADVSGKGISAAFIMAELRGIIESLVLTYDNPKEILVKTNAIIERTLEKKNFITAVFGVFDLTAEKLLLSRAGHSSILCVRNNEVIEILPGGVGLGLTYSEKFEIFLEEYSLQLKENDIFVLYTDGVTEAKNGNMDDFGITALKKIISDFQNESVDTIAKKIMTQVSVFSQGTPQHDDITLLLFKWKNNLEKQHG
jgi:serine phosphatase RsbU (regulator of sigma subunit)